MKTVEEISKLNNLIIISNKESGGTGLITYGSLKNCSVIWSREEGGLYDHVSIAPKNRMPSWDELCKVKDMFFYDEEECFQVFPKKSEYVNIHKYCLHIWRNIKEEGN